MGRVGRLQCCVFGVRFWVAGWGIQHSAGHVGPCMIVYVTVMVQHQEQQDDWYVDLESGACLRRRRRPVVKC